MIKNALLYILLVFPTFLFAQKTMISGVVTEEETGQPIPYANVFFKDSKVGAITDFDGSYTLETYYATDELVARASGFDEQTVKVRIDQTQVIDFQLSPLTQVTDEVTVRAPSEKPSTILHKRIVRHKPANNKEKLDAYEYENYNKIQLDLNNISQDFEDNKIVKNLNLVLEYLDTMNGGTFLPLILTESISNFYYRTNPTKKKEVITASRVTGVDNLELNQFLGEMYQDINVYDNYIGIFGKSFISPISNIARSFYKFYLQDSAYIDSQWCYLMTFKPKRPGDLTFEGEMWIHDTTYAVKQWSAHVNEEANINYVNGFYLEQKFELVEPEVWMITYDRLIVDLKITRGSKLLGFYGRKLTTKKDFVINKPRSLDFYKARDNVIIEDDAKHRSDQYWSENRHSPLNNQEERIEEMIDSLNNKPLFKFFKNLTFLATTGFYPVGPIEIGDITSLISFNPIEGFRNQLKLRTSNEFSKRVELAGRVAYGYRDKEFKYGGHVRFNITPKKRGMLKAYYDYDVKQLGLGDGADDMDAALGSLIRTKPLTLLTSVEKLGMSLEKDLGKSFIVTAGAEWKELKPLGDIKFRTPINYVGYNETNNIRTFETSIKIRYAKNEEFISGAFDRVSVSSKLPIITLEGVFGMKGVLNSDYKYQKVGLSIKHSPRLGIFGTLKYEVYGGYYFGEAAYPFLKIHEGSQTYWFQNTAHNKMEYFEFISDRYVGASLEHHFNGLILDLIPWNKYLKWRVVASAKSVWGDLSERQRETMLMPEVTKSFGDIPYVESAIGIENIFKFIRVDVVWRMTHLDYGMSPVGVRAKFSIRF